MLKYLKEHILEEIEGSLDYMTKAIEVKEKSPANGCTFYHMAMTELNHANNLTKIFNKCDRPDNLTDAEYAEMHKAVLSAYTDGMTKIEALKTLFWSE